GNRMYFREWISDLANGFGDVKSKIQGKEILLERAFDAIKKIVMVTKDNLKKIVIVGNGGSSAIASHISQDIMNKLKIPSLAISDASLITCMSNDFGYENVFAKPLEILLNENDLLIAI